MCDVRRSNLFQSLGLNDQSELRNNRKPKNHNHSIDRRMICKFIGEITFTEIMEKLFSFPSSELEGTQENELDYRTTIEAGIDQLTLVTFN
mgnify:CR=1 FL=1